MAEHSVVRGQCPIIECVMMIGAMKYKNVVNRKNCVYEGGRFAMIVKWID